jgi:nucleotide-binding universal stress UspA family protein
MEDSMYTRIIVPLDGSKIAEESLPYAQFLGSALKIPLELLAVVDVVEIGLRLAADKSYLLQSVIENTVTRSEDYLRQVGASYFNDVRVRSAVKKGVASEVIIDHAAEDPGALICMSAYGGSGRDRWLLGSVAEKVLRGASNPVLLYRPGRGEPAAAYASIKAIVVPLDGSELAETVLGPVVELARRINCRLILFRAYHVPYTALLPAAGYYPPIDYTLIGSFREEATSYLERKAEALRELGVQDVSCLAKEGLAADSIISLAREEQDNLVAMCTHGRSGIGRWVLGSVTETVVRHSGDPVLVIRAQS